MPQPYSTEAMIDALRQTNGLVSLAAKRMGCSASTIYSRAHTTKSVQQAITDSREELVDIAELALRAAVTGKEAWAVALVLKTLGKNRGYVERQEVTGADGEAFTLRFVKDGNTKEPDADALPDAV
jgi:hypothetical protein